MQEPYQESLQPCIIHSRSSYGDLIKKQTHKTWKPSTLETGKGYLAESGAPLDQVGAGSWGPSGGGRGLDTGGRAWVVLGEGGGLDTGGRAWVVLGEGGGLDTGMCLSGAGACLCIGSRATCCRRCTDSGQAWAQGTLSNAAKYRDKSNTMNTHTHTHAKHRQAVHTRAPTHRHLLHMQGHTQASTNKHTKAQTLPHPVGPIDPNMWRHKSFVINTHLCFLLVL